MYTPAGNLTGAYSGGADPNSTLDNTGPFTHFVSDVYWFATVWQPGPSASWVFNTRYGNLGATDNSFTHHVLVLRPGDVAAVPEPEAWGLMVSGLALVGAAARRRKAR